MVSGMADACRANGCALIGGETAQMPGFYHDGEYDLAGFIVGVVEGKKSLPELGDTAGRFACSAFLLPACTPTAIRWHASFSFEVAKYTPDQYINETTR